MYHSLGQFSGIGRLNRKLLGKQSQKGSKDEKKDSNGNKTDPPGTNPPRIIFAKVWIQILKVMLTLIECKINLITRSLSNVDPSLERDSTQKKAQGRPQRPCGKDQGQGHGTVVLFRVVISIRDAKGEVERSANAKDEDSDKHDTHAQIVLGQGVFRARGLSDVDAGAETHVVVGVQDSKSGSGGGFDEMRQRHHQGSQSRCHHGKS